MEKSRYGLAAHGQPVQRSGEHATDRFFWNEYFGILVMCKTPNSNPDQRHRDLGGIQAPAAAGKLWRGKPERFQDRGSKNHKNLPCLGDFFGNCVCCAIAFCFLVSNGHAADRTWNGGGGDNNWSTGANWGGAAPVNNDNLIFSGSTRTSNTND